MLIAEPPVATGAPSTQVSIPFKLSATGPARANTRVYDRDGYKNSQTPLYHSGLTIQVEPLEMPRSMIDY